MVERTPIFDAICQIVLFLGLIVAVLPFLIVVIAATHDIPTVNMVPMPLIPGHDFLANIQEAWTRAHLGQKIFNSIVFAAAVGAGKVVLASMAAFSIVYFRFPGRWLIFWAIFITLMLPLEVRIVPTYAVAANALQPFQAILDITGLSALIAKVSGIEVKLQWGLLNSYTGLVLPLVATATGTFLYRQFFLTIPDEICEAAKMDGSGPVRFFLDVLLPLSKSTMIALFTIMFVWAWNQYLWPLLATTDPAYGTAVTELKELIPSNYGVPDWNVAMAGTLIVMLPPLILVIVMQRWFVRGLIATEK
ncbi:ABC transporter permease subunit [Labrys wisconsinensis]|uniref:sn-glycerol-3-phosphate transport system permease protein UgpE n=1 Tax=Labrys wisconsinensis TaxID=425677 RepID=A0ABU0J3X7_9HYPH|nr:ABC transporter permease subunit [Labrys wisconsinensis]MDQ0468972.1 sn-glycerol 3-phosphate transport system permease protein [Labrys wisconsinensis]